MPVFNATEGDDTFVGTAAAVDTVDYSQGAQSGGVKIFLYSEGLALTTGNSGTDRLTSIDNVIGTDFNDNIVSGYSDNEIWGMGGDDTLGAFGGHDTLHGGAGDDFIDVSLNRGESVVVYGDAGMDTFWLVQSEAGIDYTADGGDGDDYFLMRTLYDHVTLTLGAGKDKVVVEPYQNVVPSLTITDFQAGEAGDELDVTPYLRKLDPTWVGDTNPFLSGVLRLVSVAGGAQLQLQAGGVWNDLVLLQGVAVTDLTPHNFAGFPLDGARYTGVIIDRDATAGTPGDDIINVDSVYLGRVYGGLGNDVLIGGGVLYGGPGDDTFYGSLVFGGHFNGGPGHDTYVIARSQYGVSATIDGFDPVEDVVILHGVHADRATYQAVYDYSTAITFYDGTSLIGTIVVDVPQSQLTGGNFVFVDADPLAAVPAIGSTAPVTSPLALSAAYAVAAGTVLHFEHDGITLRTAAANFTNAGTVVATYTSDSFNAVGIDATIYTGPGLPTLTNTSSGHILITSAADGTRLNQGGNVRAMSGGYIVNDGDIQAASLGGTAGGVLGRTVTNRGSIKVWAYTEGVGALGQVINTGTIEVHGVSAVGVVVVGPAFAASAPLDTNNWSFFNAGTISAYGSVSGGMGNITVSGTAVLARPAGDRQTFYNSGTLAGDYSFYTESLTSPPIGQRDDFYNTATGVMIGTAHFDYGADRFDNAGRITGLIDMGADNDTIRNSGVITGKVDLGDGDDLFAGAAGQQSGGGIHGGAGNDTVQAGRGAQIIFGGDGNDNLSGGAGDDWIDGGFGLDVIAGGDGTDTLSYRSALGAVTVNLTSNVVSGSATGETISGFESVIGGRYGDTLTGTSGVNRIEGGHGDDTLSGLGGADMFVFAKGDGHDTVTDFRVGGDADRIDVWGYTEWQSLSQVGADTLVRFDAYNSLLLRNTLVANVATGMFAFHADSDPHDLTVSDPALAGDQALWVTQDVTLLASDWLDFSSGSGRQIGNASAVTVRLGSSFDSYGHIVVDGDVQSVGIEMLNDFLTIPPSPGAVVNHAGGVIAVTADAPLPDEAFALGIKGCAFLANAGEIRVRSSYTALGVQTAYQGPANSYFDNSGILAVRGARDAYGIKLSDGEIKITNSGAITVNSDKLAIGVYNFSSNAELTFINSGSLTVMASPSGVLDLNVGTGAIAFFVGGGHYINSGLIRAEYAFYGASGGTGVEIIENTGTIYGKSLLLYGDDQVINSGRIEGLIDLGDGQDLYDGHGGTQKGGVLGGNGDDIFIAGSGDETFDGGDGVDMLSFAYAGQAVTVGIADGAYTSPGHGVHRLAGFENLSGSAYSDTLGGNSSANVLDGGRGDDLLTGGAGADTYVFRRGDGHDTIIDFDVVADVINVDNVNGFEAYVSSQQEGTDTRILFSTGDSILLLNVSAASLTAANFRYLAPTSLLYLAGTEGNDTITGHSGPNTLDGFGGNDNLAGNISDDVLRGGEGSDVLTGSGGGDRLDGGGGMDTMTGGLGNDTYVVDSSGDSVVETVGGGADWIESGISYVLGATLEVLVLTGSANLSGTGNAADNMLYGNTGNNVLEGGDGQDYLYGGDGSDTASYASATRGVTVSLISSGETVGAGFDIFNSIENLLGSGLADTLTGNETANSLDGGLGTDVLYGLGGNDSLDGGAGVDTLFGGMGNDTFIVDSKLDIVNEIANQGTDTVRASVSWTLGDTLENLTLTGSDKINGSGNDGNNTLIGNENDNVLDGGKGTDHMDGGAGNDIYRVDNLGDVVTDSGSDAFDEVLSYVSYTLKAGDGIEYLHLQGLAKLTGTGNDNANNITGTGHGGSLFGMGGDDVLVAESGGEYIDGGIGADTMIGASGNDTFIVDNINDVVILVDGGTDTVMSSVSFDVDADILILTGNGDINATGGGTANMLIGNSGNNVLDGDLGADTLKGGLGNDSYYVENNGDKIIETNNQGNDSVFTYKTFNLAGLYVENLTLTGDSNVNAGGNGFANVLTGNIGNNTLNGGLNADTMIGGAGNDVYFVDNIGDVVTENLNEGKDTVFASIPYTLSRNVENLTLTGYQVINGTGNDLANVMTGNGNVNRLDGGVGNDILVGQGGNDILTGGAGTDQFRFAHAGAANGLDHVSDFVSDTDKLAFAGSDYGFAKGHILTAAEFHTSGGAVGAGAQLLYNAVNHTLYWDGDGVGGAGPIAVAVFDNAAALRATDFVFL